MIRRLARPRIDKGIPVARGVGMRPPATQCSSPGFVSHIKGRYRGNNRNGIALIIQSVSHDERTGRNECHARRDGGSAEAKRKKLAGEVLVTATAVTGAGYLTVTQLDEARLVVLCKSKLVTVAGQKRTV